MTYVNKDFVVQIKEICRIRKKIDIYSLYGFVGLSKRPLPEIGELGKQDHLR